jgi:hypothetical protein
MNEDSNKNNEQNIQNEITPEIKEVSIYSLEGLKKKSENYLGEIKNIGKSIYCKGVNLFEEKVLNNYYFNLPNSIVKQCNNKNRIEFHLKQENYTIEYKQRKIAVILLSSSSMLTHFVRSRSKALKIRWFIPYYIFYSLLFCRENLDPIL